MEYRATLEVTTGFGAVNNPTYCETYPRIMVEEQIKKMRELIAKAKDFELDKCYFVITFIVRLLFLSFYDTTKKRPLLL